MNDCDKKQFMQFMHDVCDAYHLKRLTHGGLRIQFEVLKPFSMKQIEQAIYTYMQQHKNAEFIPKPGDVIKVLTGHDISPDEIIASAKIAKTPLGILSRILIGTHDLNYGSLNLLRKRADECIQNLADWKQRSYSGTYSDHEISIMLKYRVDPTKPFHDGLERPNNIKLLKQRVENIFHSQRHQFILNKTLYLDAK
jgi:hypothetical protein